MKYINIRRNSTKSGFTLLEILLVVAIIAILAGIVIVAINPSKQLGSARDSQRKSDINAIYKAVNQYYIDNGRFPSGIADLGENTDPPVYVCNNDGSLTPQDCVNLALLFGDPTYIPAIPTDPAITADGTYTVANYGSGYRVSKSGQNIYVDAPLTEIGFTKQAGQSSSDYMDAFVGVPPTTGYPVAPLTP